MNMQNVSCIGSNLTVCDRIDGRIYHYIIGDKYLLIDQVYILEGIIHKSNRLILRRFRDGSIFHLTIERHKSLSRYYESTDNYNYIICGGRQRGKTALSQRLIRDNFDHDGYAIKYKKKAAECLTYGFNLPLSNHIWYLCETMDKTIKKGEEKVMKMSRTKMYKELGISSVKFTRIDKNDPKSEINGVVVLLSDGVKEVRTRTCDGDSCKLIPQYIAGKSKCDPRDKFNPVDGFRLAYERALAKQSKKGLIKYAKVIKENIEKEFKLQEK